MFEEGRMLILEALSKNGVIEILGFRRGHKYCMLAFAETWQHRRNMSDPVCFNNMCYKLNTG